MAKKGTNNGGWAGVAIFFIAGVTSFFVILPLGAIFIFLALVLGLYLLDERKIRTSDSSARREAN
jgi:hypothetical protein